jgi:hypothetical protein
VERVTCKIKNVFNLFFPFIFGKEIKEHMLINNWANGWRLEELPNTADQSTLIIIFLPQYLEFLGFLLLIITFILILISKNPFSFLTGKSKS